MAVEHHHAAETIIDTINEDHYGSDDDYPVSDLPPISDAEVSDITLVTATSNNTTPKNLSESFETQKSFDSGSQLVGCTPTHKKTSITTSQRSQQLNDDFSTTSEVTFIITLPR